MHGPVPQRLTTGAEGPLCSPEHETACRESFVGVLDRIPELIPGARPTGWSRTTQREEDRPRGTPGPIVISEGPCGYGVYQPP